MAIAPIYAQQPAPAPNLSAPTLTPAIEDRVSALEREMVKIETAQTHLITALTTSNDQYKFLITAIGAALAALVVIQGFVTSVHLRREGKRDSRQVAREDERDQLDRTGVTQVSEIMKVVKETIENRLDAEKEARAAAKETREQLEKVLGEVKSLDRFFKSFQTNIRSERMSVEDLASRLAQVPRHGFRQRALEVSSFAQRFDTFKSQLEPLAEESEESHAQLGAKALYIRGIAAHYANQPEVARKYLAEVTEIQQPEPGEPVNAYKRRIANAYYYLGVMESNFGKHQSAVDSFNHAMNLDPESTDFLTKVVAAEAYFMKGAGDFPNASRLLSEVDEGLQHKKDQEDHLSGVYLRLRSRAALIRANMAIIMREANWQSNVREVLLQTRDDDPNYYYATATMAQVLSAESKNEDDASNLFHQAYDNIERSGDLLTVMEARSHILLRMVAGLCCRQGIKDYKRSEEHLDRAEALLSALPSIDGQVCTVFSTLTKRNERSEIIREHLGLIRKGDVLAKGAG